MNVSYICSRYYRAPELIFGATDYTTKIGKLNSACNNNREMFDQFFNFFLIHQIFGPLDVFSLNYYLDIQYSQVNLVSIN